MNGCSADNRWTPPLGTNHLGLSDMTLDEFLRGRAQTIGPEVLGSILATQLVNRAWAWVVVPPVTRGYVINVITNSNPALTWPSTSSAQVIQRVANRVGCLLSGFPVLYGGVSAIGCGLSFWFWFIATGVFPMILEFGYLFIQKLSHFLF